jgi:uncharacterized protein (DUF2147 family)
MKNKFYVLLGMLIVTAGVSFSGIAASNADDVCGEWWTESKDAKIMIYKTGDQFCGRISWTSDPNEKDGNNPDPALRSRKMVGLDMISGFKFKGSEWINGKIYDPESGKTYSCKMWMNGKDVLFVKGYIGVSLLGEKEQWTRVK